MSGTTANTIIDALKPPVLVHNFQYVNLWCRELLQQKITHPEYQNQWRVLLDVISELSLEFVIKSSFVQRPNDPLDDRPLYLHILKVATAHYEIGKVVRQSKTFWYHTMGEIIRALRNPTELDLNDRMRHCEISYVVMHIV